MHACSISSYQHVTSPQRSQHTCTSATCAQHPAQGAADHSHSHTCCSPQRYATRARNIRNKPVINANKKVAEVAALKGELEQLRGVVALLRHQLAQLEPVAAGVYQVGAELHAWMVCCTVTAGAHCVVVSSGPSRS